MLTDKPKGNTPLGTSRRSLEDNIKSDLEEIGINKRNLIDSAHDSDCWKVL